MEGFKNVTGYEGRYKVSGKSDVYSLVSGRLLTPRQQGDYLRVSLYDGKGNVLQISVHIISAREFVPNPLNKKFVNHKDGIKMNNDTDNLEWVTHKENMDHAKKLGLFLKGEDHPGAKLTNMQAREILKSDKSSRVLGREYGVSKTTILRIREGGRFCS